MENKLASLFGTNNVFTNEDCLVAQGDTKMITKAVDTLFVEFDQAAYEEYPSSHSRSPSPLRTLRK